MTEATGPRPSALPIDRAFVVQFDPETTLAAGRLGGRVEHVHSGHSAHFESLDQLLAFVGQVLSDSSITIKEGRTHEDGAEEKTKRGHSNE